MTNVILVAHILVSIVLVIVVLMQRSEGGALGIGGGGGGGGLMSAGGVKGALVRTTIIFGAIFFISSLTLTTLATKNNAGGLTDIQEELNATTPQPTEEDELNIDGLEDILGGDGELLDDPLAVTSSEPEAAPVEEDPLATEPDPQ